MKILAADKISGTAVKELREFAELDTDFEITPEQLLAKIKDYEVIIVRSRTKVTKEVIDASNLKAIVRAGVGTDNIDLESAEAKGIQVINTPEAPTESVAELAIGMMLALARNLTKGDSSVKSKEWLKKELSGFELQGKILGIIGLGRIGSRVAELAHAFGMQVLVYDIKPKDKYLPNFDGKQVELSELLKNSDFVSVHVSLNEETKGMLNEAELGQMKPSAYLINTARGPIVDETALYSALKQGKIAGAGLDVYWEKTPFDSKIMEVKDKIVFTPHLGSSTSDAQDRIGELLVEKIKALK